MQISSNFRSDKFFKILESFAQGLDFSRNVQNAVLSVSLQRSTSQEHRQKDRSCAPYGLRSVKLYNNSLVQVSKTELQKPVLQKPSTGVSTIVLQ